ncbi:MAG: DUF2975 domain-containing protein [Angelakisella sp.]
MKQSELANWLRGLVVVTATVTVVFLLGIVPLILGRLAATHPAEYHYLLQPGLVFVVVALLPALIALCKVWKICGEIAKNNSFSQTNAGLLRDISRLCLVEVVIFLGGIVWLFATGHKDIFVLLLLFGFIFLALFIAVLTAALSHLTEKASLLKHENDLTI